MVTYNPVLLERHVKRLNRSARFSMISTPLFIAVIGAAVGAGFAYWVKLYIIKDLLIYAIVGAIVGLLIGILAGLSAASRWREEAQMTLAVLRIEQNTRPVQMDTPDFIPLDTSTETEQ